MPRVSAVRNSAREENLVCYCYYGVGESLSKGYSRTRSCLLSFSHFCAVGSVAVNIAKCEAFKKVHFILFAGLNALRQVTAEVVHHQ